MSNCLMKELLLSEEKDKDAHTAPPPRPPQYPLGFIAIPLPFALHFASGTANRPELAVTSGCTPGTCCCFPPRR